MVGSWEVGDQWLNGGMVLGFLMVDVEGRNFLMVRKDVVCLCFVSEI